MITSKPDRSTLSRANCVNRSSTSLWKNENETESRTFAFTDAEGTFCIAAGSR
jgi:hypothetical protein